MNRSPRRHEGLKLTLLVLALMAVRAARAQEGEGEWIDLEPLREARAAAPAAAAPVPAPAAKPRAKAPAAAPAAVADEPAAKPAPADRPPIELPRRFIWKGAPTVLGRVGYVYLGDFYFVEERDVAKAELCYAYALKAWPECGPIQTRMELLSLFMGDWLRTAASMQVGFDQGAPPPVVQDYGLTPESPLLSDAEEDVPPVPAILFRQALGQARQLELTADDEPARSFLVGRLLAFLGEREEAIRVLGPVALADDEEAGPWNFQAASQRAALYLAGWQPELAYMNLLRARDLVGEHPLLMERLAALEAEMALSVLPGEGEQAQAVVRILGQQGQGRWILSPPRERFAGRVEVAAVGGEAPAGFTPHLLYRGRDYWLMTAPLGNAGSSWKPGTKVTLTGARRDG
jgi:hypothetical protein